MPLLTATVTDAECSTIIRNKIPSCLSYHIISAEQSKRWNRQA